MSKKIVVFAGSVREFRYYVQKACDHQDIDPTRFVYGNTPTGYNFLGQEIEYVVYFGNFAHNTTIEMISRAMSRIYGPIKVIHHDRTYRYEIMQRLDQKFIMSGQNFMRLPEVNFDKLYDVKWGNDSTWIMDHPYGESYKLN